MKTSDRHQQAPTPVRMPEDLKAVLKAKAEANERSLNGEIVIRLRESLQRPSNRVRGPKDK
ncbi:hypothetical protein J2W35_004920 [Variovorax boronicumulans]|uniref:Arc family DNA-binding protein n=1 Tax=Variovorax boronicumulans TaxID=436515 RepID=UPI0027880C25|nr:Arc family DNA-binding protein [Variovorax boronicumulans]MDQ0084551.1 hypothetical protein [Variovorax boronicumulans]